MVWAFWKSWLLNTRSWVWTLPPPAVCPLVWVYYQIMPLPNTSSFWESCLLNFPTSLMFFFPELVELSCGRAIKQDWGLKKLLFSMWMFIFVLQLNIFFFHIKKMSEMVYVCRSTLNRRMNESSNLRLICCMSSKLIQEKWWQCS